MFGTRVVLVDCEESGRWLHNRLLLPSGFVYEVISPVFLNEQLTARDRDTDGLAGGGLRLTGIGNHVALLYPVVGVDLKCWLVKDG